MRFLRVSINIIKFEIIVIKKERHAHAYMWVDITIKMYDGIIEKVKAVEPFSFYFFFFYAFQQYFLHHAMNNSNFYLCSAFDKRYKILFIAHNLPFSTIYIHRTIFYVSLFQFYIYYCRRREEEPFLGGQNFFYYFKIQNIQNFPNSLRKISIFLLLIFSFFWDFANMLTDF